MKITSFITIISLLSIISISGLLQNCAKEVLVPESAQFSTRIQVLDTSYVTTGIYQNPAVSGAEVTLTSVNYNLTYQSISHDDGWAVFHNLIPDFYNCSVQKTYPEDTIFYYLGYKREEILVGSLAALKMSSAADSSKVLLKQVPRTPFVISEIYYNGAPPPPPLYYHDQFTEIYNNSSVTEYLDGYIIGDMDYGYKDDPDFMYSIHLYQFPGSGTIIRCHQVGL